MSICPLFLVAILLGACALFLLSIGSQSGNPEWVFGTCGAIELFIGCVVMLMFALLLCAP